MPQQKWHRTGGTALATTDRPFRSSQRSDAAADV